MHTDFQQKTCCLMRGMTGIASTAMVGVIRDLWFCLMNWHCSWRRGCPLQRLSQGLPSNVYQASGSVRQCWVCLRVLQILSGLHHYHFVVFNVLLFFLWLLQSIPPEPGVKNERQDLNLLLQITTARMKEKMPNSILSRAPPPPAKNPYLTSVCII